MRMEGSDYGHAHSLHANVKEFIARHEPQTVTKMLRVLGWDV
jgi:hypothetical protein